MSLLLIVGCVSRSNSRPTKISDHLETDLYGSLDAWEPVNFTPKPSISMNQHTFAQEGGDADPDISPDANWIVFSSMRHAPNPDLYIKRVHGATVTRLTSDPASEMQPQFSPSGDKVVYTSNRSGNWDIWMVAVDGSSPTQLTNTAANDIHPAWSPDGKQIVYSSYGSRSRQWELWVVDTGTPSIKKIIGYGLNPIWSPNPDVPKIAFQQARFRGSHWYSIWTLDFVDGEARFPTEIISSVDHACISPAWSPNGSRLAYSTVSGSTYDKSVKSDMPQNSGETIFVIDLDGRNNLQLTNEDASSFAATWSNDDRIFFCSDRKGIYNIWSVKPSRYNFAGETKSADVSQNPSNQFLAN